MCTYIIPPKMNCICGTETWLSFGVYMHLQLHSQTNLFYPFQAIANMNDICKKANVPMAKAALSWVLNQPNVPVAIVGARTPEQMVENCEVVDLPQVMS